MYSSIILGLIQDIKYRAYLEKKIKIADNI